MLISSLALFKSSVAAFRFSLLRAMLFGIRNTDFGDAICVVYRRNNGGYGIIETEDDEE